MLSDADLCTAFDKAVASNGPPISDLDDNLPEKHELDALYNQAVYGNASAHVFGGESLEKADEQTRASREAWERLQGTPKTSAMRNYISRSNALYRDALEHQLKGGA